MGSVAVVGWAAGGCWRWGEHLDVYGCRFLRCLRPWSSPVLTNEVASDSSSSLLALQSLCSLSKCTCREGLYEPTSYCCVEMEILQVTRGFLAGSTQEPRLPLHLLSQTVWAVGFSWM